jgi:hypothetical protein
MGVRPKTGACAEFHSTLIEAKKRLLVEKRRGTPPEIRNAINIETNTVGNLS